MLRVGCKKGFKVIVREETSKNESSDDNVEKLACVMKFGGSSLASTKRMREVTDLVHQFCDERYVIILSAMGKTTSKLLLARKKVVSCGVSNASKIDDQSLIRVTLVGCHATLNVQF